MPAIANAGYLFTTGIKKSVWPASFEITVSAIGTPAVRTSATHDLYLTVMDVLPDGRVGIRAIVTPAVVWIWIGVLIMAAGMGLCLVSPSPVRRVAP